MASIRYTLQGETRPRVEIAWVGNCEDLTVHFNGVKLGEVTNRRELERGRSFPLGDAGQLEVRLAMDTLHVFQNGERLFGTHYEGDRRPARSAASSGATPEMMGSAVAMGFVCLVNLGLGLLAEGIPFLSQMGPALMGWGVLFGVLAFFTGIGHRWAAVLGFVLFLGDAVMTFVMCAQNGVPLPMPGMFVKAWILWVMFKALPGMGDPRPVW